MRRLALILLIVAILTTRGAQSSPPLVTPSDPAGAAFFETNIRPLLLTHCYSCHSANTQPLQPNLRLDDPNAWRQGGNHGPALIPGKPEESLLIHAVRYTDPHLQMPPAGKLSPQQIHLLETWIAQGAPGPRVGSVGKPVDIASGKK